MNDAWLAGTVPDKQDPESKSLVWSALDAKKKRQMLSSAHSAANKEMKKYFEKMMLPDIQ